MCLIIGCVYPLLDLPVLIIKLLASSECSGVPPQYLRDYFSPERDACEILLVPFSNCTECDDVLTVEATPEGFASFLVDDGGVHAFNKFMCRHQSTFEFGFLTTGSAAIIWFLLLILLAESPRPPWPVFASFTSMMISYSLYSSYYRTNPGPHMIVNMVITGLIAFSCEAGLPYGEE